MIGWVSILFYCSVLFAQTPVKVVILGDSLTEGYGIAREKAFPALVEKKLQASGKTVEIVNGGTSGATSASGPSRLRWFLKAKPQVLVLALGANDGLRGLKVEQTKENLSKTIELAQQNNLKVLLAGMKVPTNYGKQYGDDLEKIYVGLAKKYKIALLPFLLEGVGGKPKLNLPDGIHPNESGHQIIAELVAKHLSPLL